MSQAKDKRRLVIRNIVLSVLLSTIALCVVVAWNYEQGQIDYVLQTFSPLFFAGAVLLAFARIAVGGYRLSYISHKRIGFKSGMRGQLAWDFFSSVTPSVIGGGPLAAVYIAKNQGISVGESTAFLLYAMLLDQLFFALTVPVVVVASFFMPVFPESIGTAGNATMLGIFLLLMLWVCLFGYSTLVRTDVLTRIVDFVFRFKYLARFKDRVSKEMSELEDRAALIRTQPFSFFAVGFLITLVAWAIRYALVLFAIWTVYTHVDWILALLRNAAMTLAGLVMPTPGGSGGLEGLYALFIGPLLPKALVAPSMFLWRSLAYYLYLFLGMWFSLREIHRVLNYKTEQEEAPDDEQIG